MSLPLFIKAIITCYSSEGGLLKENVPCQFYLMQRILFTRIQLFANGGFLPLFCLFIIATFYYRTLLQIAAFCLLFSFFHATFAFFMQTVNSCKYL